MKKIILTLLLTLSSHLNAQPFWDFIGYVADAVHYQATRDLVYKIDNKLADIAHHAVPSFLARFPREYKHACRYLLKDMHNFSKDISYNWLPFINDYAYAHGEPYINELENILENLIRVERSLYNFYGSLRPSELYYYDTLIIINRLLGNSVYEMSPDYYGNYLYRALDAIAANFYDIGHELERLAF